MRGFNPLFGHGDFANRFDELVARRVNEEGTFVYGSSRFGHPSTSH